jgi:lipopolysaccharide/colanic/teichoic acid biosynthesis glycosyltransferase
MPQSDKFILYTALKSNFDFLLSLLGLVCIAPVFLVIILILKFSGEGEVFYLQERVGFKNKLFFIYKFATMLKNSSNMGNKNLTVRNDPRITKFGRILRITKINELPQILNVVKGDMSLVGPRPLLEQGFFKYHQKVKDVVYESKPGITGIGSLIFRDEELLVTAYKNLGKIPSEYYTQHIFPYKGNLELWYYQNKSLSVDCKILFLTFWSLIKPSSKWVYSIFKNLPAKPNSLTLEGIKNL